MPHAYAAAVMMTTIARVLGVPQEGELVTRGQFDWRLSKELFMTIVEHPTPVVAAAARTAYEKLFSAQIPNAELGPWQVAPISAALTQSLRPRGRGLAVRVALVLWRLPGRDPSPSPRAPERAWPSRAPSFQRA